MTQESTRHASPEIRIETPPKIHTPYYIATLEKVKKEASPDVVPGIQIGLENVDSQLMGNFSIYHPKSRPGVAYSTSKVEINPKIVEEIAATRVGQASQRPAIDAESTPLRKEGQKIIYFLFSAFGPPGADNVFLSQDEIIDRYMRLLALVAGPMRRGEPPPTVEIHVLGSTNGLGGKNSPESLKNKSKNGFAEHGTYYGDYILDHIPTDPEELAKSQIVIQGVSRGGIIATEVYKQLPGDLKPHFQVLRDNYPGSGAKVALGLVQEIIHHMRHNPFSAKLDKERAGFESKFAKSKGLSQKVTGDQIRGFLSDAWNIIKGVNPEVEGRFTNRQGIDDPLVDTTELNQLIEIELAKPDTERRNIVRSGHGYREFPFKGRHFFDTYQRISRWGKNIRYCWSIPTVKAA